MAGELDVLHLDMDCFFAAVEARDDPRLAGVPLIVGGTGNRGVVCSASYEARAYGVHSAMPTAEARRLCPRAVYVSPRHGRYGEVSDSIHGVLRDVTPLVEPLGLDEAFLEVSGSHRLLGSSEDIAAVLRDRIARELGLPCSVGVGRTKLVAKLASKAAKPGALAGSFAGARRVSQGIVAVDPPGEVAFLHRHPVRALPGVGPRTEQQLRRFGVGTVGDLAAVPLESLERLLGAAHGAALHALAAGRDERPVTPSRQVQSIGHEETFAEDVRDREELARRARAMADDVAARCRRAGYVARTVSVKLRYADFSTQTRARTLPAASAECGVLADAAVELLAGARTVMGVRLLGVQASSLAEPATGPEQLELFVDGPEEQRREAAGSAAASVRERFGAAALTSARALSGAPAADRPTSETAPGIVRALGGAR